MLRLFFLFALLIFATSAPAAELAALEGLNRLLQAEYQLAKDEQLYVVFDLPLRQARIKASGVELAGLPIAQAQWRGRPGPEGARILTGRQASAAPQRIAIDPGAERKPGAFELQALEIGDMPVAYRLLLDDGGILTVAPQAEDFRGRAAAAGRDIWWRLSRPLISKWHSLRGKPYTELRLTMTAHDARRLYWSYQEGMACLIVWRTP